MNRLLIAIVFFFGCANSAGQVRTLKLIQDLTCSSRDTLTYTVIDSAKELLISRKPIDLMIAVLDSSKDDCQRKDLFDILYNIPDDQRISELFKRKAFGKVTSERYFALMYLGKQGNMTSLAILDTLYWGWPVSSIQRGYTATLFGTMKYQPGIPRLVESLDAASLNLVDAAYESLFKFYPDAPKFSSLDEAENYFKKRTNYK